MNFRTQIPVYYDDIEGWLVLSDETIPAHQLLTIRDYVYRVNKQRAQGMKGDKKKRVERALQRLQTEGVKVRSSKPGMTLFQSTEKMTTKSYHSIGGLH